MNKFYSFVSLAKKAGKVVGGEVAVVNAIQKKTACLILIASDASKNTKKKFTNSANFYHLELAEVGTKEELGQAIGEEFRAVLCITDLGFAKKMISMINDNISGNNDITKDVTEDITEDITKDITE